jgi:hypothetical protein
MGSSWSFCLSFWFVCTYLTSRLLLAWRVFRYSCSTPQTSTENGCGVWIQPNFVTMSTNVDTWQCGFKSLRPNYVLISLFSFEEDFFFFQSAVVDAPHLEFTSSLPFSSNFDPLASRVQILTQHHGTKESDVAYAYLYGHSQTL